MLDPFEYIDRLINGLCYFIYNFLFSVSALLTNPTRGILRLSSRFRSKGVRQASDFTLIFSIAVASSVLLHVIWSLGGVLRFQGYREVVDKTFAEFYDRTFGSTVATTIIFAVAVSIVYLGLVAQLKLLLPAGKGNKLRFRRGYYCCYLFSVFTFAQIVSSALLLFAHIEKTRYLLLLAAAAFLAILAFGAVFGRVAVRPAGIGTTLIIYAYLFFAYMGGAGFSGLYALLSHADDISISALRCKEEQHSKVRVTAVVSNTSERQLLIRHSDILVTGEKEQPEPLYFNISEPDTHTPFVLLPPKQSTLLSILADPIKDVTAPIDFRCKLRITAVDKALSDSSNRTVVPRRFNAEAYDFGEMSIEPAPAKQKQTEPAPAKPKH
jgi:hypothetical protein